MTPAVETVIMSVRVPIELRAQLQHAAKASGLSLADVVRLSLKGFTLPKPAKD